MSSRVLFVDDEVSLLNGIQRRLGTEYDLVTASSGRDALAVMDEQGPFPVIVTDMRMPKMDGVQFIKTARQLAPDSVYIMLTGNQDQATAIQALNEGSVFRFLTKPCQSADIKRAVDAGLRQYQLVTAEKELLHNTFVGAIRVLTDVLELTQPNIFARAERLQEIVAALEAGLRLECRWEYKLAARLGLVGYALLPEQARIHFESGIDQGEPWEATIRSAADTGQRIIERIPRLKTVARMIGLQPDVDGSLVIRDPKDEQQIAEMGATLLRVVIQWENSVRHGLTHQAATDELRLALPRLSNQIADVLEDLPTSDVEDQGVLVSVAELEEGMVLQEDVLTSDGVMLIREGRRLTWTLIERLRSYQSSEDRVHRVRVSGVNSRMPEPALV